jgi:DNA polymerase III epsilon subunit-like protein
MMICPKCITNNPNESNYCLNCGYKINDSKIELNKLNYLFFFDIETTGLIDDDGPYFNYIGYPRLVQIGWLIYDINENKIRKKKSHIIKPNGYSISEESLNIHGITDYIAHNKGIDIFYALGDFYRDMIYSDMIFAHNLSFDKRIMSVYLNLYGFEDVFNMKPCFCTMELSKKYCAITDGVYADYKFPKLSELYSKLFPWRSLPTNLHDALVDSEITLICFVEMLNRNIIEKKKFDFIHFLKEKTLNSYRYVDDVEKIVLDNKTNFWGWDQIRNYNHIKLANNYIKSSSINGKIEYFDEVTKNTIYRYEIDKGIVQIIDWKNGNLILELDVILKRFNRINPEILNSFGIHPSEINNIDTNVGIRFTTGNNYDKYLTIHKESIPFIDYESDNNSCNLEFNMRLSIQGCFVQLLKINIGEIAFIDKWLVNQSGHDLKGGFTNRNVEYIGRKIGNSRDLSVYEIM